MIKMKIKKLLNAHPHIKSILMPFYKFLKIIPNAIPVSNTESNKKKIYFDITSHSVSNVKTGIQRVVAKFLEYFEKIIGDDYELVCISGLNGYHVIDQDTFLALDKSIQPGYGDIYLSIDSNPVQPYEYWDTLKTWQRNGCRLIACVYDLVYIKYPEYVQDQNAAALLSRWLKHAVQNFDGLICISQTVEHELLAWMHESQIYNPRLKTGYFHLGADFIHTASCEKDSSSVFFRQACKNKPLTFLAVATIEPRKGYADLVEAFEALNKEHVDASLIIVGRVGWKYEDIVRKMTASNCFNQTIFWFSDCDDHLLEILYQISDCYISGSYYEGFGLGIIEASNKGLPVLLRDLSVNREVSENKGLYYKNNEELELIIKKVVKHTELLHMQNKIQSLSWEESTAMAWASIQKMV